MQKRAESSCDSVSLHILADYMTDPSSRTEDPILVGDDADVSAIAERSAGERSYAAQERFLATALMDFDAEAPGYLSFRGMVYVVDVAT